MSVKKSEHKVTSRYGKPSSSLLNIKSSFFQDNDLHLEKQEKIASIYRKQIKRKYCKNCDENIENKCDFVKDQIGYFFCEKCGHLNGIYEDTNEFCDVVYAGSLETEYAKNYSEDDINAYNYRTTSIYMPKAEFLCTSLLAINVDPHKYSYLDFGAGSGYFVSALKKTGLKNIRGTEVSNNQVNFGNGMIGEDLIDKHNIEDTNKILSETTSNLVSMIGVLEHLINPREVLNCIKNNKNIEYFYISVPTFSLSVYLEIFSDKIFHRQLHGGHTHLYTENSISHLCTEFGFDISAEWWFGADFVDLFRHFSIGLEKQECSNKVKDFWKKDFIPVIDALQLELDKKHLASEVHLLLRKIKQ